MSAADSGQDPFDRVAEAFLAEYRAGARPAVSDYVRRHPELAAQIRDLFPALVELEEMGPQAPAPAGSSPPAGGEVPRQLGDFRIVREVGRGGMGVVYEAVQESLGRHVALKVLPPQAVPDPLRLRRFRREARSVARLHHTNIVPVHEVGEWRGVHYYAMQFIRGQGLDQVLHEVRRLRGPPTAGPTAATPPATVCLARGLLTGRFRAGETDPGGPPPPPSDTTTPVGPATGSDIPSQDDSGYYRSVAGLGLQAAEALAYAHGQGVLHRDVKPSNLLLDDQGRVWLTDFGLAKEEAGDDVTGTGDLVGTLRYIAPERFRGQTDARSDVYSLGLTLYELLTLRPAFDDTDRHALVRRVTQEEPPRPRQLDRRIPRDLETIILKAIAREPARRYPSAAELAEDLRRFLDDRPVLARRPTLLHKVQKWSRRNPAVVGTAALGLLATAAVLAGSLGWVVRDRTLRREQAAREATAARQDIDQLRREGKWAAARAVARRAEALLADADPDLRREFTELGRDLEMAARLEEIRLGESAVKGVNYDLARADPEYARAFRAYGIDVEALPPAEAADLIRARAIPEELAAALDDWAGIRGATDERGAHRLRAVARAADPDPERNRLRDALESGERQVLEELAASKKVDGLPPSTLVLLAGALRKVQAGERAEAVLRRAQQLHPDDFWINQRLAYYLVSSRPPRPEEATRFYTAAVAIRPQSPGVHLGLGFVLRARGKQREAAEEYRRAIDLQPDYAAAHNNLGSAWKDLGELAEAEAEFRRATQLQPDFALAYYNLGTVLLARGKQPEAVEEYRRAIDLQPDYAAAHNNLGGALRDLGKLAEAGDEFRRAIQFQPDHALAHCNLGGVLWARGKRDEAVKEYRRAIDLQPDFVEAHNNLGSAWQDLGKLAEAEDEFRRAIRSQPHLAVSHYNLGTALSARGKWPEAVKECHRAIELQPDFAEAHNALGCALVAQGNFAEAEAEFHRATQFQPHLAVAHSNLGRVHAHAGRWEQAAAAFATAFEREPPEDPYVWLERACVLLQLGRAEEYRKLCARMREHCGRSRDANPLSALAHTCALGPDAFPDAGIVLKLAEQRLAVTPSREKAWSKHVLGLASYRAGRYDQAAACLGQALQDQPDWEHNVLNWLVLAMAEQRLGHGAAARRWRDKAEEWVKHKTLGAGQGGMAYHVPGWLWRDCLMVQLFRREAEALLRREGHR
jgi:tetratricopeptide (TPR) repeat protein/serine/threonine protein kinase